MQQDEERTTTLFWNDPSVSFSDDFDDNVLTYWTEFKPDSSSKLREESQIINLSSGTGNAHTGVSAFVGDTCDISDDCYPVNLNRINNYTIKFDWKYIWNSTEAGNDGITLQHINAWKAAVDGGNRETYYGGIMGRAIFYSIGRGCLNGATPGIVIAADDASSSWHCGWEHEVYRNTSNLFNENTWYPITILINWLTNYTELYIGENLAANGTIGSAWTKTLGSTFNVELHVSHYPYTADNESNNIDNFSIFSNWTKPIAFANESRGREAFLAAINSALTNSSNFTDKQIYVFGSQQYSGRFDVVAISNQQTWAFNYIYASDNATNMTSLGNSVNILEIQPTSYQQIYETARNFILSTKT